MKVATVGLSLREAIEARPALRQQLGETCYRQLLAIADDPTPEVIERQNSIWLQTVIPMALKVIAKAEPTLARHVAGVLLFITVCRSSGGRVEPLRMEQPFDTWEEKRGER